MKTRVQVVFPAVAPDEPTWPYIGYDVEARSREVTASLERQLPELEFVPFVYRSETQAAAALQGERFDGYLVYMTSMWTGIPELYAREARPVVIADEPYSGSGGFLRVHSMVRREGLPVVTVGSSNFLDIVNAVRLFDVMRRMREARTLVVADGDVWGARQDVREECKKVFGTEVIQIGSDKLRQYYDAADDQEAERWKDRWIGEAAFVAEPDEKEILRSARLYLALKAAMQEAQADAVTVDCLGLFYAGKLPAYPCLGFFQLNNEGSTGVCEADVDSMITQLVLRYVTGRPGYVSDPVLDTTTGQITYAHCVATNRVFGPGGLTNPYIIRSHAEDHKGAAVQSLMPIGHQVTSAKVSLRHKSLAVHNARTVANVNDEKGCRTKLAAEARVQKLLDNYHFEIFSWHRVTCYGDFRQELINLATLYGLKVYEEDR